MYTSAYNARLCQGLYVPYIILFSEQYNENILSLLHLNNIIDCGSELKFIWVGNGEDEI